MKIAVTGATGFIGRSLCRELKRAGHEVVALSRDPKGVAGLLDGVEVMPWGQDSAPALPAVDGIVHLAGESVTGRWTAEKKHRIRESRVEGTRRLVEAMRRADPRPSVLVSTSAVGYYGDRGDETLTEESGPGGDFLALVCRDWEAEAGHAEELGLRVVSLRLGVVLAADGGALASMLTPFRLGVGGPLGSGRQWFPWIHRADAVGLYRFALECPAATGPINAVAPQLLRNREFTRHLAAALRRPALLPTPGLALRALFGEFAATLLASQRVLPARAPALGYAFQYPDLATALRQTLDDTHENLSPGTRSDRAPTA